MNLLIWIFFGGILGWIASRMMETDDQQGVLLNVVVGVVGAFIAGLLLSPLLGVGTINQSDFSFPSMLISLLGAVILLALVNAFRGRRV
jgi:uncharacterized membrane protein YeaQ/YmgE (transglycosylase-associated protein family)